MRWYLYCYWPNHQHYSQPLEGGDSLNGEDSIPCIRVGRRDSREEKVLGDLRCSWHDHSISGWMVPVDRAEFSRASLKQTSSNQTYTWAFAPSLYISAKQHMPKDWEIHQIQSSDERSAFIPAVAVMLTQKCYHLLQAIR